jgi:hypothetical protein
MTPTAISNSYYMQAVPKDRTEITLSVNGKRASCHRCGPVQVLTIRTFHLGKIDTGEVDEYGSRIYKPKSIDLCSHCHAVIQHPAPAPKPKPEKRLPICTDPPEFWNLTTREQAVLILLQANPLKVITYEEFRAIGISSGSRNANIAVHINQIRRKMPELVIECVYRQGYMLVPEEEVER